MNKNSAKRFLSIIIVLTMVMTNVILATSAFGCAGAVSLTEPVKYIVRGELIENGTVLEVVIDMENNVSGLWAALLRLKFNPDAIRPIEENFENGNVWDEELSSFSSDVYYDEPEYEWLKNCVYLEFMSYDEANGCCKENGTLVKLQFKVVDPYAEYGIELSPWANSDYPEGDPSNHICLDVETFEFVNIPVKANYALPDIQTPPDTEYEEPVESEPVETEPEVSEPEVTETENPESSTPAETEPETSAEVVYSVIGEVSEDGRFLNVTINMDNNVNGLWNMYMFLTYNEDVLLPVEDSIIEGDVWSRKRCDIEFAVLDSSHILEWARNSVYMSFSGRASKNVATAVSGTVVTLSFEILGGSDDLGIEFKTWCTTIEYYHEPDNHASIIEDALVGQPFTVNYDLPVIEAPETTAPPVTEPPVTEPETTAPVETSPEVYEEVVYNVIGEISEDGKYLDVTINMDNNLYGLWAAMLFLTYDTNLLCPVADSIENGNVWSYKTAAIELDFIEDHPYEWAKNTAYINFSGNSMKNAATKLSGVVATLSFEIIGKGEDLGIELKPWCTYNEYSYEFMNHVTYNTSKEEVEEVPFTVYYELPSVSAPDTEPVVPDTSAPDTAPDTSVPDTSAPDTSAPDTSAPDTAPVVPDTTAPDTAPVEPEDTTVLADAVVYNVEAKKLNCGSVMEVTIKMENNSGLWSSIFALKYNPEALKIEYDPDYEPEDENDPPCSIENGNVWSYRTATIDYGVIGVDHPYEWAHNSVYISYTGNDDKNAATKAGGTLVKIRFEVLDPEADPEFELILWCADMDYYYEPDNHSKCDDETGSLVGVPFTTNYNVDASESGHKVVVIDAVAPTCTEEGCTEGEYCELCGKVLKEQTVVSALGHTEEKLPAVAPTCTEKGYSEGAKCTVCDKLLKGQIVYEALGHEEEELPAVAPTCTETGITAGLKCTVCGETLVEQTVVDALGHTEEELPAVAPTCTETGLTAGVKCSVCGEVLVAQKIVDALGHTEEELPAVAPNCTETGLTAGVKCSVCGEILVEQKIVDALGHTEEEIPAVAPNCTETGLTAGVKCSVCGEVLVAQKTVDALGHTEEEVPAVAPTCTETGLTAGVKCSVCGEILVAQNVVGVLGHTAGEWVVEKEATEEETGLKCKKCVTCGEVLEEEEIPKIIVYFNVIVNGESIKYKVGETVTVAARQLRFDEVAGKAYVFSNWTVSGVTVEDNTALEISFVMPRCDVVITENTYLHGDVNDDKKITAADTLALLVAMKTGVSTPVCDVNLDGKITAADKLVLSQIQKGTYTYN